MLISSSFSVLNAIACRVLVFWPRFGRGSRNPAMHTCRIRKGENGSGVCPVEAASPAEPAAEADKPRSTLSAKGSAHPARLAADGGWTTCASYRPPIPGVNTLATAEVRTRTLVGLDKALRRSEPGAHP